MDAVMKVLKELERQAQAEAERRNQAFQETQIAKKPPPQGQQPKRKKQKKQSEQAPKLQVADDNLTPVEAIPTSAGAEVSVEPNTSKWNRQRILDALTLTIALGPPPGLSDDW